MYSTHQISRLLKRISTREHGCWLVSPVEILRSVLANKCIFHISAADFWEFVPAIRLYHMKWERERERERERESARAREREREREREDESGCVCVWMCVSGWVCAVGCLCNISQTETRRHRHEHRHRFRFRFRHRYRHRHRRRRRHNHNHRNFTELSTCYSSASYDEARLFFVF